MPIFSHNTGPCDNLKLEQVSKDSLCCTINVTNIFTSLIIFKCYKRLSKINHHCGLNSVIDNMTAHFYSTLCYNLIMPWINKLNLHSACSKIQGCIFLVHSCCEVSTVTKLKQWGSRVANKWEERAFRWGSRAVYICTVFPELVNLIIWHSFGSHFPFL